MFRNHTLGMPSFQPPSFPLQTTFNSFFLFSYRSDLNELKSSSLENNIIMLLLSKNITQCSMNAV
jgi:hypothetical protein